MSQDMQSTAILVLGMHRSGTSVLARAFQLGGVDIGSRLLGASAGNEGGHWEDAFAVETHERLLAMLGRRWDDLVPLPAGWGSTEIGLEAAHVIGEYVRNDRALSPLWAVKDPRLCQFGGLWRDECLRAGMQVGVVLAIRHPWEVARSLAARDGLSAAHGLLLWLQNTLGALSIAEGLPTVVVDYQDLLDDWRAATGRLRSLPGGEQLAWDEEAIAELDRFVDASQRHHHHSHDEGSLPTLVDALWRELSAHASAGTAPAGLAQRFERDLEPLHELLTPIIGDFRVNERKLWERVGRAESALAGSVQAQSPDAGVEEVRDLMLVHHDRLMEVLSQDIRRMQDTVAAALDRAARAEERTHANEVAAGSTATLGELAVVLDELRGSAAAVTALGEETRQALQALHAEVSARHESLHGLAEAQSVAAQAYSSVTTSIAELQPRLLRAVADAEARQQSREQSIVGRLQAVIEDMRSGFAGLRREQGLEAALRDARASLETARAAGSELQAQSQSVRQQLQATLLELDEMREAFSASASESAQMRDERDALVRSLAEMEARLSAAQASLSASFADSDRLRSDMRALRQSAQTLARVMQSRSWRWTRPLRVLKRLLTTRWSAADMRALRAAWRRGPASQGAVADLATTASTHAIAPGDATALEASPGVVAPWLADAQPGLPDVFVWAVIDWDFRFQRPQHLATSLARRGHRVFYISNNFVDDRSPGFRADPIDGSGRLFQVNLNLDGAPAIYFGLPSPAEVHALHDSLASLLAWTRTSASMSLVQHPYWLSLVRSIPNARVVYDCMDHHAGFENNASSVLEAEERLLGDSDLVIVTSLWLEEQVGARTRNCALVRNACDYHFFRQPPAEIFRDPEGRRVIGYYGAIAEWFDVELVRELARAHPQALVVLVGSDTIGAGHAFAGEPNIKMVGEVRYADLPYWLHAFDVALLPFRIIPLTLATNPVKVYEYLAAGVPVVVSDLPEMVQFQGLVRIGRSPQDFIEGVGEALVAGDDAVARSARREFAAGQTWDHRALAVDEAIATIEEPLVSVVVLTYNNLAFTQACLFSIEAYSDYSRLEVIVVDNASSDGSREWLRVWVDEPSHAGHQRKLVLNEDNLGFSAGNNIGLAQAQGEILVLLNNDTYVTHGWVRTLAAHLRRDPALGLVGPVTNNIGNEAKIDVQYADIVEMHRVAGEYTRAHPGASLPMRNAAFFCVAMPRAVYQAVGGLDEAYGVGFFEDDDYCRRVEALGLKIACAEDVFVHHHLSASFSPMGVERKQALFERNKAIYESKWGAWQPHAYRPALRKEST